jgi:hypothetical protein
MKSAFLSLANSEASVFEISDATAFGGNLVRQSRAKLRARAGSER